ncbi:HEPN domain-containing protein [Candidatus Woesearchaeota archaeon]|nr:HEPN domain-containing protein [Candidatus Woesearchaeota archaeon]
MNIQDCLKKRFLIEEPLDQKLITKELNESSFDFKSVEKAFDENNFKWVIIQCYYSMFHAAKSVCFNLGYREKKHFALLIILEYLNEQGQLEKEFVTSAAFLWTPRIFPVTGGIFRHRSETGGKFCGF